MSIYNRKHDVLFIHVPKCAGTSMERREFLGGGGHYPYWVFKDTIEGIADIFKFTFVRNPYDRLVSAFFHDPHITPFSEDRAGFQSFVKTLKKGPKHPKQTFPRLKGWPFHNHFIPQWWFACLLNRRCELDFVGRFENLKEDWKKVCDEVGVDDRLTHERKGPHEHYSYYYDDETKEIVADFYGEDFKIFDYEK